MPPGPPAEALPISGVERLANAPSAYVGVPWPLALASLSRHEKVAEPREVVPPKPSSENSLLGEGSTTQLDQEDAPAPPEGKPARKRSAKAPSSGTVEQKKQSAGKGSRTSQKRQSNRSATRSHRDFPASEKSGLEEAIPPITDEAVSFLGKQNPTPADVIKLDPESLAFVRHHFDFMEQVEAASKARSAYLLANARPMTPGLQKFSDVLGKQDSAKKVTSQEKPKSTVAVSKGAGSAQVPFTAYGPKVEPVAATHPVPVHLGKLDIALRAPELRRQSADAVEDRKRANKIIGTAQILMSEQIDALTPQRAAELVTRDLDDLRAIKLEEFQRQALQAMVESSFAQPRYKVEFDRQAPDLAREQNKVETVHSEIEKQALENSIEPSPARFVRLENDESLTRSMASTADRKVTGNKRPTPGARFLSAMGTAAQTAAFWLSNRSELSTAEHKQPMGLKNAQSPVGLFGAADKSTAMPELVKRRFLQVDQDYFFPDRTPAFSDRGNKLSTRGAHIEVVRSLVEIAKARGWDSITIKGTDEFRQSVWKEATLSGLGVAGYKPTPIDLAELANRPANNSVEKSRGAENEIPFSSLATKSPGAPPALDVNGKEATKHPSELKAGKDAELAKKAKAFEENKPTYAVKKYPDLVGAYGIVEAAKAFAIEKLPEAAREEFIGMARRHVMHKIITGDVVKGPQIYLAPSKEKGADAASQKTVVDDKKVTAPPVKEVAKER
jgi:hypothetical protein